MNQLTDLHKMVTKALEECDVDQTFAYEQLAHAAITAFAAYENATMRSSPLLGMAAEPLAIAVLRLVDAGHLDSRSAASDALMSWADMRFGVQDGTGIAKLRALAGESLPPLPAHRAKESLSLEALNTLRAVLGRDDDISEQAMRDSDEPEVHEEHEFRIKANAALRADLRIPS